MCTSRSSSETGLWARARLSAIALISCRNSVIERLPLGVFANLDFKEMMRDREDDAKLELSRSHASRAVEAEEIRGWIESEQLPRSALKII